MASGRIVAVLAIVVVSFGLGSANPVDDARDWALPVMDQTYLCAVDAPGCADGALTPVMTECGDLDCDPAADEDGDGISDLAEWQLCGVPLTKTLIDHSAVGLGECRSETDYSAPAVFPYATPLPILSAEGLI